MSSFLCWIWPYLMGGLLGWLAAGWLARQALARKPSTIEKVVERKVDRPVDRIVEKVVDNPAHLAEITSLKAAAGLVPGLRAQLSALQSAAPSVIEKKVLDTAGIEERDRKIADWSARYAALEGKYKLLYDGPAIDVQAAHAAGVMLKGPDDLEIVEGIGPKIAELLNQAGVHRFRELAQMTPAQIQPILDRAGPHFALANPSTWPEQAALAANNHWASLKALQDVLIAGLRK